MKGKSRQLKVVGRRGRQVTWVALLAAASLTAGTAVAQVPVDDDGNPLGGDVSPLQNGLEVENPALGETALMSVSELETLVGPIALYPDDLLAIVLPASTYPLEIVQAARFLERAEHDASLKPDEDWDDSVVALLNYPDVLNMMNADIDWTWKLGEAVVGQQSDVILAIETFRDRAFAAGNLKSDDYQNVVVEDGIIEIEPVDDDVIYVPYYEPARVVHYSPTPVFHYYPRAYPVYYYPYPSNHYFTSRFFWGVTTAFTIGWATDRLHVYHHSYHGHPFYGYSYYGSYWRRPSIHVYNNYYVNQYPYIRHDRYRRGDYWRPRYRSGSRPKTRVTHSGYNRDRNRDHYYRDRRTDGLDYNRARPRRPSIGGSRNATRDLSVRDTNRLNPRRQVNTGITASDTNTRRAATEGRTRGGRSVDVRSERDRAIKFRPRGDGSFSARRSERIEPSANNVPRRTPAPVMRHNASSRDTGLNRARSENPRISNRNRADSAIRSARASRATALSRPANRIGSGDRVRQSGLSDRTRSAAGRADVRSQPSRSSRTSQRSSRPSNPRSSRPSSERKASAGRAESKRSDSRGSSRRAGRSERVRN